MDMFGAAVEVSLSRGHTCYGERSYPPESLLVGTLILRLFVSCYLFYGLWQAARDGQTISEYVRVPSASTCDESS